MSTDVMVVFLWWTVLFLFGVAAFPLSRVIFRDWWDDGYGLSKALGLVSVTAIVWLLSTFHLLAFNWISISLGLLIVFVLGVVVTVMTQKSRSVPSFKRIFAQEIAFFLLLAFWSWIKAHEPSIRGLEKFMDYGFTKSILNTAYLPAPDIWYAGESINYYTFGHTMMAVISKFSGVHLAYGFNLMLATLFALCASMSFAMGVQIILLSFSSGKRVIDRAWSTSKKRAFIVLSGGFLTGFLVTLGGNLQTIYAFTPGYRGEDTPPPFWKIFWPLSEWREMIANIPHYWYANATRFIPNTIHEFPSYSFVVSDVHGHVLSIPLVLLAIAFLITIFVMKKQRRAISTWVLYVLYGFLVSTMFMTNALDGPIYLGLFVFLTALLSINKLTSVKDVVRISIPVFIVMGCMALLTMPFLAHFKSFVTGVGVNCPIEPFVDMKIGPFLFEGVEKCQHSPLWMLLVLWGFFLFHGLVLIGSMTRVKEGKLWFLGGRFEWFWVILFVYCTLLLIFPEFFYFKDIYPGHFRSNTMFKLGYQVFIMMSLMSGMMIIRMLSQAKNHVAKIAFGIFLIPQLALVSMYPFLAVNTYFARLSTYKGIYGLSWMKRDNQADWQVIHWFNEMIDQLPAGSEMPVIIESHGESYTDHARVSAFTGLPAVVGWPVHEWLWRGTYDVVSPRIAEVATVYTDPDITKVREVLDTYNVSYIIVGDLERSKYEALDESKLARIGHVAYEWGSTRVYEIDR